MRYYLDTNILVFLLFKDDDISNEVSQIITDYANTLFTSSICIQELIHLSQIGKFVVKKGGKPISPIGMIEKIDKLDIRIVPVSRKHLEVYASLPVYDDHRDPNDRLVIAQAISDRIPLISSDHKFAKYERYGLDFIFNER